MTEKLIFLIGCIVLCIILVILGRKIQVAYPVLLVLAGLAISFIPGLPLLEIDSELIFIIFLPPLLFEAAWNISWKNLWKFRRSVMSFAFPLVLITAVCVAFVANYFIPGFSLALGFLLGGIISPPDAVSAGAIMKFVKVPRVISTILEGESLLNDASSLIIFRFALIAVATGQFVWYEAMGSFVWMVVGGVAVGLLCALVFIKTAKKLSTDATMDTLLVMVAPFVMYLLAEELHASGVLSVVSGGLFMASRSYNFLGSASRLRGVNGWELLTFVLNGLVFVMIGLDLPQITAGLGDTSMLQATGYALIVTATIIVLRIIAAYCAVLTTLVMRNFIHVAVDFRNSTPETRRMMWRAPVMTGWAGMRGVVSLAAALSIPMYLENGEPFPQRNLILYITFVVILVTLIVQGLTLPWIIKKLNLPEDEAENPVFAQKKIQRELQRFSMNYVKENYGEHMSKNPHLIEFVSKMESKAEGTDLKSNAIFLKIYREIILAQRESLIRRNREEQDLDEDAVRHHLRRLDVEEERLAFLEA